MFDLFKHNIHTRARIQIKCINIGIRHICWHTIKIGIRHICWHTFEVPDLAIRKNARIYSRVEGVSDKQEKLKVTGGDTYHCKRDTGKIRWILKTHDLYTYSALLLRSGMDLTCSSLVTPPSLGVSVSHHQ